MLKELQVKAIYRDLSTDVDFHKPKSKSAGATSHEIKMAIVDSVLGGKDIKAAAIEFDVHLTSAYTYVRDFKAGSLQRCL